MEQIWEKADFFLDEADFDEKMNTLIKPLVDSFEEGYIESREGKLHYYAGVNPHEKASMVICHGFCEFFAKYHEFAYYLYEAGYSIFFVELKGHGFSERVELDDESKVYIKTFDEYVSNLHELVEQVVRPKTKSGRLILFGHSMGGCISTLYAEKYPEDFEKIVLSSPMHKMSYGGKPEWMAVAAVIYSKLLRKGKEYAPGQRHFNSDNWFERSSSLSFARWNYIQELRKEHAEYRTFGGTYAWTGAAIFASKKALKNASKITRPVLLMEAGRDRLVNNEYHHIFAKKLKGVKLLTFPEAKHEIFNAEKEDRIQFYRTLFEWIG